MCRVWVGFCRLFSYDAISGTYTMPTLCKQPYARIFGMPVVGSFSFLFSVPNVAHIRLRDMLAHSTKTYFFIEKEIKNKMTQKESDTVRCASMSTTKHIVNEKKLNSIGLTARWRSDRFRSFVVSKIADKTLSNVFATHDSSSRCLVAVVVARRSIGRKVNWI